MRVAAQIGKAIPNRGGRHGLQPQARDRMLAFGILLDQPKNQLALPARVAGIDDGAHILALGEFDNRG